jgi:glycosyltransferase involved in cell wall biosynthesis
VRCFIVIAAFNEAACVGDVVREVRVRYPDVVVVDDGSNDATAEQARDAGAIVLSHAINRGQGAALQTGMDYALQHGAEAIVTFDADGQHRAEDIETLLAPVRDRAFDVALGSRFLHGDPSIPPMRKLTLRLAVIFTRWVSGIRVTDTHNGLRAFSRDAAARIAIRQDRMAHASEILDTIARYRMRYCEVPTDVRYTTHSLRKGQRSSAAFRIALDFLLGRWEE